MMTEQEIIDVVKAFKEGKEVEFQPIKQTLVGCSTSAETKDRWLPASTPQWNFEKCIYRVKPKPEKRAFSNKGEAIKEGIKHGHWVRNRFMGDVEMIVGYYNASVFIGGSNIYYKDLFDAYVWADDSSPVGFNVDIP